MSSTVHGSPESSKPAPRADGLQEAEPAIVAAVLVAMVYFRAPVVGPRAPDPAGLCSHPLRKHCRLRIGRVGAVILTVTLAVLLISASPSSSARNSRGLKSAAQQNIVAKISRWKVGHQQRIGPGRIPDVQQYERQIANAPRGAESAQLDPKRRRNTMIRQSRRNPTSNRSVIRMSRSARRIKFANWRSSSSSSYSSFAEGVTCATGSLCWRARGTCSARRLRSMTVLRVSAAIFSCKRR